MKCKSTWAIGLCAVALLGCAGTAHAAERGAKMIATAGETRAKLRAYRKRPPLQVDIYRRRIGGYSYKASDVTGTYRASPPPYDPALQSPGGPFDSGFFFDSGMAPHGGNSPYLH